MFDGPKNPRPALWFTMKDPFAYMSATVNLWKEPMELKESMTLTYGVAVWDGVIKAEDGRGMENELHVVEGLQFDRGFVSPYFISDTQKERVVLEDALVLLYPKNVTSVEELLPVLEQVIKAGHSLLIISDDLGGEALATLVINTLRGTLKTCAVKAPGKWVSSTRPR